MLGSCDMQFGWAGAKGIIFGLKVRFSLFYRKIYEGNIYQMDVSEEFAYIH